MKKTIVYFIALGIVMGFCSIAQATIVDVFETAGADGYTPWNHPTNTATYNAWRAAIGETPDFREDWDGLDWQGAPWLEDELFDIQNVPTAIFTDGVTFGNIGADSDERAVADDSMGGTDAIDLFGWSASETGIATINFATNQADYLGFYIFDTDHDTDVTYTLTFSDGSEFIYPALGTDGDRYRFVGFVNNNPSAKFIKFEVDAPDGSLYGIDELEWGRFPNGTVIPEPSSLLLLGLGLFGASLGRKTRNRKGRFQNPT